MGHKECMYHDNDALLYAVAKLGEHDVILSARETEVDNEYLGYAKNEDKELSIDADSARKRAVLYRIRRSDVREWNI